MKRVKMATEDQKRANNADRRNIMCSTWHAVSQIHNSRALW